MAELTKKQKRFCQEYIIDLNGTQAAIRAGYSAKTADVQASRLLGNVNVKEYIQSLADNVTEKLEITSEDILNELKYIGFSRINNVVEVKTESFTTIEQIGEDAEGKPVFGEKIEDIQVVRMKDTADLDDPSLASIASIKQTRDGIEYKMNDKMKALELLGKYKKLFTDKHEVAVTELPEIVIKRGR